MATYEKCTYDIPPYQEGNLQDFEFELDANFPIEDVADVTFQVRSNPEDELIISKKLTDAEPEITVVGRVVNIQIKPDDTLGFPGRHLYEVDLVNADGEPFATIGGLFVVNKQINTL